MGKKGTVLVICAHSDDQIFGPGGTLVKYARSGSDVHTIIFSFGEGSHPHMKPEVIRRRRIEESQAADKIIGAKGVRFLGFREGKFLQDYKDKEGFRKLRSLIKECRPDVIFTHSKDDPFTDHRAVHDIVLEAHDKMGLKCKVYSFQVWNFFSLKRPDNPRMIVDTSKTFHKKIAALRCFKSQINILSYTVLNNLLFLATYVRDFMNGVRYDSRFAEVFWLER